mmetsp:Transcript_17436/g.48326  ORF Transcript_17436/g.48326 Transcript_17436/m.48326 type:complete len:270 (+) Transcript_17436:150-959(+)
MFNKWLGPHRMTSLQDDVGGEWSHDLSCVWLDNAVQKWHRSWDGLLAQESEDTQHGEASVVGLGNQSALLLLLGLVLRKVEWIVQVEWDLVWDGVEGWEGTWLAALGVVELSAVAALVGGQLGVPFQESDEGDDLDLGGEWKGIPLLWWREVGAWHGDAARGQWPWEDEVGLHAVSNECCHGNTSVLDLTLLQPSDGALLVESPESGIDQTQWIPELDEWVERGSLLLQVSLGGGQRRRGAGRRWAEGEGSSTGGCDGEDGGGLHGEFG